MGIEAFAEAALCMLPGWQVEAIEDVSFLAPFKFYRSEPRAVRIETQIHPQGERLVADCRLIGTALCQIRRSLKQRHTSPRACGSRNNQSRRQLRRPLVTPVGSCVEAADIYRLYFHGPAYQVVERAWWDGNA